MSATGENEPCTGFSSKEKLKDHAVRHSLGVGAESKEDYQQKGIAFLKQACDGDIVGYAREDGSIVRFNTKTCEYAVRKPGGKLKTYMSPKCNKKTGAANPKKAMQYYELRKEEDLNGEKD